MPKPLAIKLHNSYVIHNFEGEELGSFFYRHGRKDRKELDEIMNELFEVKE